MVLIFGFIVIPQILYVSFDNSAVGNETTAENKQIGDKALNIQFSSFNFGDIFTGEVIILYLSNFCLK